ncbi:MAG TPA: hypothetical protein VG013_23970 [Gemmataceae bacterium]|nr:hypothetical protein [Gemmataceae bacterium]
MESLEATLRKHPYLLSPATLMRFHLGEKWKMAPHLRMIDDLLMGTLQKPGLRIMLNMPSGHGKSNLVTKGYVAWRLLWEPHLRVIIIGHGEEFAVGEYGAKIKEIIEKFGPELGVRIRPDTRSKGDWQIDRHGGGVSCYGPESGVVGHHCELFLIDDLVRNREMAMSPGMMDKHWGFYEATVYGRLRNEVSLVMVGTRWSKKDIFGRVMEMEKAVGEWRNWVHLKFTGLAKENDILGRKPGEALWPEAYSQKKIDDARRFNEFFDASYQQDPSSDAMALMMPSTWPKYTDITGAFSLQEGAAQRTIFSNSEIEVLVTVDWASSSKSGADFTAILVGGLTPDGRLLIFECTAKRLKIEEAVRELAAVCRRVKPHVVACEAYGFQASMANECRRFREIPEVRRMEPDYKAGAKMRRAYPAIIMGQNSRIFLPDEPSPWKDEFMEEVRNFTGIDDDHDDMVDALGYMAQLANQLRGASAGTGEAPCVLIPAPERS